MVKLFPFIGMRAIARVYCSVLVSSQKFRIYVDKTFRAVISYIHARRGLLARVTRRDA